MEDQILQYVGEKGQSTAGELLDNLGIPRSTLFRILDELVDQGKLAKIGNRPYVVYKLPSAMEAAPTPVTTQTPEEPLSETPPIVTPPTLETSHSPALLYWCKFLHLDPQAVTVSYQQIRSLMPNYQSIGMEAPKSKQLGLKLPDPIWVKFFNLLTWISAIVWTILKNGWSLFRKFFKGEIPWGPILVMVLAVWLIVTFIVPLFVKPREKNGQEMSLEQQVDSIDPRTSQRWQKEYDKTLDELRAAEAEISKNHGVIDSLREGLEKGLNQEQADDLKFQLESQKKKIKELEEGIKELEFNRTALKEEKDKRQRLENQLQNAEQEANTRVEEWEKKERSYEKKIESSKAEIQELEADLSKTEQESRQLKRELQKQEAEKKELEGEIEGLKKG